MYKVWFENSKREEREIAEVKTEDDIFDAIKTFCDSKNFKIYYIRTWESDGRIKYDVGSHSEFFYSKEID